MLPKIKNAIIFVVIGAILVLVYVLFIKQPSETPALVSSNPSTSTSSTETSSNTLASAEDSSTARDFLNLLLSVKSIKLNDAIFSDKAFASLHDSSIVLIPDGNEGRINPFAPIGVEATPPVVISATTPPTVSTPPTTTKTDTSGSKTGTSTTP